METLTNEVSAKEPELRAALAAEGDVQEVIVEGMQRPASLHS